MTSSLDSAYPAATATPRYFFWSACAIPLLILSGFAMVSTAPVLLIAYGALLDRRLHTLRLWAAPVVLVFATAFIGWALRGDLGISLTSTLNPLMTGAIVAAALVLVGRIILFNRKALF